MAILIAGLSQLPVLCRCSMALTIWHIASAVTAGCACQVYLPKGPAAWYDFYGEAMYEAGAEAMLAAPLERLPLLVAAGGMLPLTDEVEDFSRLHDEPSRCLRCGLYLNLTLTLIGKAKDCDCLHNKPLRCLRCALFPWYARCKSQRSAA